MHPHNDGTGTGPNAWPHNIDTLSLTDLYRTLKKARHRPLDESSRAAAESFLQDTLREALDEALALPPTVTRARSALAAAFGPGVPFRPCEVFFPECRAVYDHLQKNHVDPNMSTYGEIVELDFALLLGRALHAVAPGRLQTGRTEFLDLGSGAGRAVMLAALGFPGTFSKCTGIELLEHRHAFALETWTAELARRAGPVHFVRGDFFSVPWPDADVVFAVSTCFPQGLMAELTQLAEKRLRAGACIVTISKQLHSKRFTVFRRGWLEMSWGMAEYFIHEDATSLSYLD
mmetsp:Transcript_95417/g.270085  ORF Transcript_95417/g.270085 Transcript_95417/m.270085 type:complete len:289 (+) Transcript_95417:54-920(+)